MITEYYEKGFEFIELPQKKVLGKVKSVLIDPEINTDIEILTKLTNVPPKKINGIIEQFQYLKLYPYPSISFRDIQYYFPSCAQFGELIYKKILDNDNLFRLKRSTKIKRLQILRYYYHWGHEPKRVICEKLNISKNLVAAFKNELKEAVKKGNKELLEFSNTCGIINAFEVEGAIQSCKRAAFWMENPNLAKEYQHYLYEGTLDKQGLLGHFYLMKKSYYELEICYDRNRKNILLQQYQYSQKKTMEKVKYFEFVLWSGLEFSFL